QLSTTGGTDFVYHAARGYWVTRYINEKQPGLIKNLLSQSPDPDRIEKSVAGELGVEPDRLWQEIDTIIATYFEQES
ncbi:MAG: hypothetical protein JXA42_09925, partial [Anaerolineales bacterium]|nr:hypothetical protein [Anaerolineales bacterium]